MEGSFPGPWNPVPTMGEGAVLGYLVAANWGDPPATPGPIIGGKTCAGGCRVGPGGLTGPPATPGIVGGRVCTPGFGPRYVPTWVVCGKVGPLITVTSWKVTPTAKNNMAWKVRYMIKYVWDKK